LLTPATSATADPDRRQPTPSLPAGDAGDDLKGRYAMRMRGGIACAVVLLSLGAVSGARVDRGEIAGTIVDASGAAVPKATVAVIGPAVRST
jgi:hypothetical protein